MKKIFAFIGSDNGDRSCTAKFAEMIFQGASKKYDGQIEVEILTSKDVNINPCKGCRNCFKYCKCSQDAYDDIDLVKNKMLDADFIIWGSPVYAHQVSGQMKILIDRLSYWLHLMILAGKPGIVISTTSSTGYIEVLSYLSKILTHMGVKVVRGYNIFTDFQGDFLEIEDVKKKAEKASDLICDYLSGREKITSNTSLESIFLSQKRSIILSKEVKPEEYSFWEKEGYFNFETFDDLLKNKI